MMPLPGLGLELLAPLGLAALIGVPAVILFHMRHTTPVVRPVPTLRFWQAVAQEQSERSRLRRPPLSMLLLLHLLIVALIAFGLTRPVADRALAGLDLRSEPRHMIVLLDGSTSMSAVDTPSGVTRFEEARALAIDKLRDLREGDVATLIVLGTSITTHEATDPAGFNQLRERLTVIDPPGGRTDLNAALNLAKDLLLPRLDNRILLVSDGALMADPGIVENLGAPIELLRVGGDGSGLAGGNVAITDLSARAMPGNAEQQQLYARVANFADEPVTVPVVLIADGIEIDRRDVNLAAAGGVAELDWPLPAGVTDVSVEVEVEDALPADDAASLILRQDADLALNILLVSDLPNHVQRALDALPGAQVAVEPPDSPAIRDAGNQYDLVVFENTAPPRDAVPDTALLFVHPPPEGGLFPSNGVLPDTSIARLHADDPLLNGVDLGGVTFGETPNYVLDGSFSEVVGAEAGPLIFHGALQERPVVVLAFDTAESNLPQRVAFPILIANIAAELAPSALPPSVPLGDPLVYRPRSDAAAIRIEPPGGEPVELSLATDGTGITTDDQPAGANVAATNGTQERLREVSFPDTGRPGAYTVAELDNEGEPVATGRFVVNAGHVSESDLRPAPELPEILSRAQVTAGSVLGTAALADLWPLLAAMALVLLAVEWLLAVAPRRRRAVTRQPSAVSEWPSTDNHRQ